MNTKIIVRKRLLASLFLLVSGVVLFVSVTNVSAKTTQVVQKKIEVSSVTLPVTSLKTLAKPVAFTQSAVLPVAFASSIKATTPFQILIPSIGVNARIDALGLTSDGKMAVPANFTSVGWYKLGAVPGDVGNAVLGAHVDNGGAISGVFKHLKDLAIGDSISIVDSSGVTRTFRVTARDVFDRNMRDTSKVFGGTDKRQVKIITCDGEWLKSENTYANRLVVTAELVL